MSVDPFDLLVDIERKCRTHAKPLPRERMMGKVWQGVGFECGSRRFVTPLSEINEIAPYPAITPLPKSAHWFLGVANVRGKLLPITDLECFATGIRQPKTPLSRILIIDFEQTDAGFLVGQVFGVQRFFENAKQPIDLTQLPEAYQEYIEGYFDQGGERWNILSLSKLTKKNEFYHVMQEGY